MKALLKCRIQWIDRSGQATPDTNDAIGVVQSREPGFETTELYPICTEHAKRLYHMPHWHFWKFERGDGAESPTPDVGVNRWGEKTR